MFDVVLLVFLGGGFSTFSTRFACDDFYRVAGLAKNLSVSQKVPLFTFRNITLRRL